MTQALLKVAAAAMLTAGLSMCTAAGVDPALLALAPANAHVLAGVQVSQAQSTPIGQKLMAQIQLGADAGKAMTEAGFDPRRDLREILVAAGEAFGPNPAGDAILLGRGTFRIDKITAAAAANGAVLSTYRGVKLLRPKDAANKDAGKGTTEAGCLAFLDASTVLAGNVASVKAAIDRHASPPNVSGASLTGPLADRARQIAAANDLWMVTVIAPSNASLGSELGPLGNILGAAQQFTAGLKITPAQVTLSADILAKSPQDAQSLADVLRFAVQMAQSNRQPGSPAPVGPSLAEAAKISVSGSTMHLVVAVPEKQLEPFFAFPAPPKRLAAR